jgi:hypothetical protein
MMNRLTCILVTLGAVLLVAGCGDGPTGPEAELRAWVADGIEAAENKQRSKLVKMISASYTDARGHDRDKIDRMLWVYFNRQDKIGLLPRIEEITIYDDTAAKVVMTVGMAGTNDGLLGFSADAYRFALELEKPVGDWQLISARWGELGDEMQ